MSLEGTGQQVEERKGLLTGEDSSKSTSDSDDIPSGWSRRRLIIASSGIIALLLCATLLPPYLGYDRNSNAGESKASFTEGSNSAQSLLLTSNGTHDFKPTVLMVSIDGLRADYLDRGLTPHLLDISRKGLRAKWMQPIFPTLTFPNHWALLTGLYAESHGIVANNFYDPESQNSFYYSDPKKSWNASWWNGEPIWETVEKAGFKTANLMWPGPPQTRSGISPTYFVPFKNHVPLNEKLDQVLAWVDLPLGERPQLILAYEPSVDQAGHKAGPVSKLVNDTLTNVDHFVKDLHTALADRNLTNIVDIIFVSDHGMTDTQHVEFVYMEKILGHDLIEAIEHIDGWPSFGLRFREGTNTTKVLEILKAAEASTPEKFSVFTKETMPEEYHFVNSDRIAPIYWVPKVGYAVTHDKEGEERMTKGNHGYHNGHPTMYSMFVADGPFSVKAKQKRQLASRSVRGIVSRMLGQDGWLEVTGETYIMHGFRNLEIYGLVTKLLGIEEFAVKTNGTEGFWDNYL
ncbi:hypothetical protein M422DRAFT_153652 [Sphaerobolus stellatus SS14]|nr:hypothetical protein M422DRAFT_153652 [Sphaerobolus stellatus SS14]